MRSNNRFLFGEEQDGLTVMGMFLKKEDAVRIEIKAGDEETWIQQSFDPITGDLIETTGDFRLEQLADLVRVRVYDCTSDEELDAATWDDDDIARCIVETACGIVGVDYDPDARVVVYGRGGEHRISGPISPKKLGWKRVVN